MPCCGINDLVGLTYSIRWSVDQWDDELGKGKGVIHPGWREYSGNPVFTRFRKRKKLPQLNALRCWEDFGVVSVGGRMPLMSDAGDKRPQFLLDQVPVCHERCAMLEFTRVHPQKGSWLEPRLEVPHHGSQSQSFGRIDVERVATVACDTCQLF